MSVLDAKQQLPALWSSLRPLNLLIASLSVLTGGVLAAGPAILLTAPLLSAALSCACALSAGNLWNDLADEQQDRINHRKRALPSGRLTRRQLWTASVILALLCLALALPLSQDAALLVIICLLTLFAYARLLVRIPGFANLVVAALCAASLLLGAMVGGGLLAAWDVAFMALLLSLLRELLKDAQDVEGDNEVGRNTLAGQLNQRELAQVGSLLLLQIPAYGLGYGLLAERSPFERAALFASVLLGVVLLVDLLRAGGPSKERLPGLVQRQRYAMLLGAFVYLLSAILGDLL